MFERLRKWLREHFVVKDFMVYGYESFRKGGKPRIPFGGVGEFS